MTEKIKELNRTLTKYEKEYITKGEDTGKNILQFTFYFILIVFFVLLGLMFFLWSETGETALSLFLSVLFTAMFVPLLIYIKNRKNKDLTFAPPLQIEGFFREEITGFGKHRAVRYYIGPFSVSVPEHWITLGFIKKGQYHRCEAFAKPIEGFEKTFYGSNYFFVVLNLDDTYSIDKEYQKRLFTSNGILGLVVTMLLGTFLFAFFIAYLNDPDGLFKLVKYEIVAKNNIVNASNVKDLGNYKLAEWQVINIDNVFAVRDYYNRAYIHENKESLFISIDQFKKRVEQRERDIQRLKKFLPVRIKKDFWESFKEFDNNKAFIEMQVDLKKFEKIYKDYRKLPAKKRRGKMFGIFSTGALIKNKHLTEFYKIEARRFNNEIDHLFKGNHRIKLKGINSINLPSTNAYKVKYGKMSESIRKYEQSVRNNNNLKISGIIKNAGYTNGKLAYLTIDCEDSYDANKMYLHFVGMVFLILFFIISLTKSLSQWRKNQKVLNKIKALYSEF
ncbi:MAG: hypothetical protein GY760_04950 [Deltaproteobacteria bacterium]|nr:hypothetical protein [Deltaproteobacteria bacterium]